MSDLNFDFDVGVLALLFVFKHGLVTLEIYAAPQCYVSASKVSALWIVFLQLYHSHQ